MEYKVELDVYNGPLDLLLYLLRRDELDIYDIPIARITDSYMQYVRVLAGLKDQQGLDINVAGDFLVMAATLMEIKSAMLLPKAPVARQGGEGNSAADAFNDPRLELVQQLLEYKRFRDAATSLERKAAEHGNRFARYPARPDGAADEPPVDLEEVQVWDLLAAFERLLKELGPRQPRFHEVTYDDTPLDLHAADIEDRIKRDGKLTLRSLIAGRTSRSEMIGVFLALLELIRQKKIWVTQGEDLGEVEIDRASDEHRRSYTEAMAAPAGEAAGPVAEIPPSTV